jgi:hypothetical protein
MQSGKTGTYAAVINLFERTYENTPTRFCYTVFVGVNDNALRDQIQRDLDCVKTRYKIEVKHIKDISKRGALDRIKRKVCQHLIIFDESHCAANERQFMDKILKEINIDLKISSKDWKSHNTKILTVSATPYTEKYANKAEVVVLNSGEGYYGLKEMYYTKKIKRTDRIWESDKKLSTFFLNILEDYSDTNSYIIVRNQKLVSKINELKKDKNSILSMYDIKVDIQNSELPLSKIISEPPSKPTLVLIKMKGRVGLQLDTTYVSAMIDTESKGTDTVVQSLAGRACGYNKNKDTIVYTNKTEVKNFIDDMDGLIAYITNKQLGVKTRRSNIPVSITDVSKKPSINEVISKYEIVRNLYNEYKHKPDSIRDLATRSDDRKLEKAVSTGNGYSTFIPEEHMYGVVYDSRIKTLYIMENLKDPVYTQKIKQNNVYCIKE